MPLAHNGEIDEYYESMGPEDGRPLLLIMGLSAQMLSWDDQICDALVAHGFRITRFDNRDIGKSTWLDDKPVDVEAQVAKFFAGQPIDAPYSIEDMADDAASVLDAVGWESAHIMGASMGGMIAQAFAIRYPERTRSLVSIMSTTGDPDVGQPDNDTLLALLTPAPEGREGAIEAGVNTMRIIGSPVYFDEERARLITTAEYDRGFHPEGALRQMMAILSAKSRTAELEKLDVPALVIHGMKDRLVNPTGGRRTHEALADSELVELPDGGHDIPAVYRPELLDKITALAVRADDAWLAESA